MAPRFEAVRLEAVRNQVGRIGVRPAPQPTRPVGPAIRQVGNQVAQRLRSARPARAGTTVTSEDSPTSRERVESQRGSPVEATRPPPRAAEVDAAPAPAPRPPETQRAADGAAPERSPAPSAGPGEPAAHEADGPEPAGHETARPEPAAPEPTVPEPTGAEPTAPEPTGPASPDQEGSPAPAAPRRPVNRRLLPVAAVATVVATADAARAIAAIRTQGALRRLGVLAFLIQRRAQVAAIARAVVARVMSAFVLAIVFLHAQVLARAVAVRSTVEGAVALAMAVATSVATSVRATVSSLTGTIRGVVSRVTRGIATLVRSVPIPDLPIAGRVRTFVEHAVGRVTGMIDDKVGHVLVFADHAVARVVGLALGVFQRLGHSLVGLVTRVVNVVTRLVATIARRLAALVVRVVKAVAAVRRRVDSVLGRLAQLALRHILVAERTAVAAVRRNRSWAVRAIARLLRSVSDDDPGEGAVLHPAETARRRARDNAAIRAMVLVVRLSAALNAKAVAAFQALTAQLASLVLGVAAAYVSGIVAGVVQGAQRIVATVTGALARLVALVTAGIQRIIAGVVGLVSRVVAVVRRAVGVAMGIVRGILSSFGTLVANVLQRIRTFLSGLVDRVVRFLTLRARSVSTDTSEVTAGAEAYTPARLGAASAAAFAAPAIVPALGAIAEGLAALGAFIAGLDLAVALWWVALILLVLLVIVLIIYLVYRALNDKQTEEKIKDKPGSKEKADPKKPRPDDPPPPPPPPTDPKPQKPWFWDPKPKIAKAGVQGALDARASAPIMHYEAHHCWPEYVGGHKDQPLMATRYSVHRTIHDGGGLHATMSIAAASSGFVLSRTAAGNAAFIAHMRGDKGARDRFSAALLGYYLSLDAVTDPPIPPPAYAPGIAYAYARV